MTVRALALAACLFGAPHHLRAQAVEPITGATSEAPAPSAHQDSSAKAIAQFVAGGVIGLAAHEGGHLLMVSVFGADPGTKRVSFGPLQFFAVTHTEVTPAREYAPVVRPSEP